MSSRASVVRNLAANKDVNGQDEPGHDETKA
jgi:hypothetical protein